MPRPEEVRRDVADWLTSEKGLSFVRSRADRYGARMPLSQRGALLRAVQSDVAWKALVYTVIGKKLTWIADKTGMPLSSLDRALNLAGRDALRAVAVIQADAEVCWEACQQYEGEEFENCFEDCMVRTG